jgi:hypothetical protein
MSENGSTSEQRRIKVEGLIFNAPAPYKAGHPLTENEANTLNQTFAENLRNNFAKKVKTAKEAAQKNGGAFPSDGEAAPDDLQQEFTSYATDYEFGTRAASSGEAGLPRDPVEREAYIMARDLIRQHAKSKGFKVDAEQIASLVPGILAKRPEIREEAQRRFTAKTAITLDELELPSAASQPQEEQVQGEQLPEAESVEQEGEATTRRKRH